MIRRALLASVLAAAAAAAETSAAERAWNGSGLATRRDAAGDLHVVTIAGDVAVLGQAARDPEAPGRLAALVAQVPGAGRWSMRSGLLTGPCLRSVDRLVCAAGVLRRADPPQPSDAAGLRAAMTAAADAVAERLDPGLAPAAAESLRALLKRLAEPADDDRIPGDYARRLLRSPWIDGLADAAAVATLRAAMAAAEKPSPAEAWEGAGCRLERRIDAFGRETWTWRAPGACRYLVPAAGPAYRPHADLRLAVDLPEDADPWRDAARATAATLWCGELALARWRPGQPLEAVPEAWALAMRPGGRDLLPGWPRPHLLLTAADGSALRLAVADPAGRAVEVAAPADGGADAESFLARAAAALPDPDALALVGDCFFQYAHDSPDPARPRLIGEPERCGDIHQTAAQTLATSLGGRFRGDCDDLAEIYTELLTRQGRLAHVMNLPRHAAAGSLRRDGDAWRFDVLQSGPAESWSADTAEGAVGAAYDALDEREGRADTSQVGVLLRFADANTRTPWVLSWRIYRDPDYARTMIAVQRDWYYRTYHHGIAVMRAMVDSGDRDTANYSELSGLYRRIGEWRAAVAWKRRAEAALGHEPTPELRLRELSLLTRAGMDGEAAAEAEDIAHALAGMAERDPRRAATLAADLLGWIPDGRQRELRALLIDRRVRPWFERMTPQVKAWIRDRFDQDTWRDDPVAVAWRGSGDLLCGDLVQPWHPAWGLPPLAAEDRATADWWYREIGGLGQGKRAGRLYETATPGWWLEQRLGRDAVDRLVAAAGDPPPDDAPLPPAGPFADAVVAAWRGRSIPWLAERLREAAGWAPSPEHAAAVRTWLGRIAAAEAFLARRGISDPWQERQAAQARLIAALALGDAALLDASLERLAARGDRAENESAAGILGGWAERQPPDAFAAALARWHAVIGSKPFALEIAWSALLGGHWDAAKAAAAAAAAHWSDDPILVEEAGRIAALAGERRDRLLP